MTRRDMAIRVGINEFKSICPYFIPLSKYTLIRSHIAGFSIFILICIFVI